jgi:hypothetical protein
VRREHVFNRPVEERTQSLDNLLSRHVIAEPILVDFEAAPDVDERVTGDDRRAWRDRRRQDVL